jgi:hypothetical protein
MGLWFTITAGPLQRSHSRVRVARESWPHFTVSDSRLHQPGGPGPRIYIPQERGGPVMPPGTGFPFRRLPRLAGLRWRYSTPPLHGSFKDWFFYIMCKISVRTSQETHYISATKPNRLMLFRETLAVLLCESHGTHKYSFSMLKQMVIIVTIGL